MKSRGFFGTVADLRRILAAELAELPPRHWHWHPGQLPQALANYSANPIDFRRQIEREAHDASMLEWRYRNGPPE